MEEIRRNNIVQSLLRHDWVYRWRAILDIVGLEPRPALLTREARLKNLAEEAKKKLMIVGYGDDCYWVRILKAMIGIWIIGETDA